MQQSPQLIQSAIEEASRLSERNGEVPSRTGSVLLAIRDKISTLEGDLGSANARVAQLEGDLRTARDEHTRSTNLHANQLIAVKEAAQAELQDVQAVATETIDKIRTESETAVRRLEQENTSLRMQVEAKSREVEGLSQAISELLAGIRANQMQTTREREEVETLLGGLMEFVSESDLQAVDATGFDPSELLGAMEGLVMGSGEPHKGADNVVRMSLEKVA